MLQTALNFESRKRMRYGVRASVAAELVAAAFADSGLARDNFDAEPSRQVGTENAA